MNISPDLKEALHTFLRNNLIAVIATINNENKPEAAVIQCLVDANLCVYFVTRRHTRKFKNLQLNKWVAIVIGTELGTNTVQIEGEAKFVTEDLSQLDALTNRKGMKDIYYGCLCDSPFTKIEGTDFAVFKVQPDWLRWMTLDPKTGKEVYYQVIPEKQDF